MFRPSLYTHELVCGVQAHITALFHAARGNSTSHADGFTLRTPPLWWNNETFPLVTLNSPSSDPGYWEGEVGEGGGPDIGQEIGAHVKCSDPFLMGVWGLEVRLRFTPVVSVRFNR